MMPAKSVRILVRLISAAFVALLAAACWLAVVGLYEPSSYCGATAGVLGLALAAAADLGSVT